MTLSPPPEFLGQPDQPCVNSAQVGFTDGAVIQTRDGPREFCDGRWQPIPALQPIPPDNEWTITGEGTFTLTPFGERFFAELQGELAERDRPVVTLREFDDLLPVPEHKWKMVQ